MPKDIWLEGNVNHLGQGFNIENDCLTPTMKMKRCRSYSELAICSVSVWLLP